VLLLLLLLLLLQEPVALMVGRLAEVGKESLLPSQLDLLVLLGLPL
jgi:hypothetical protein